MTVLPAVPAEARQVTVGPARLARWIDGFADRHGAIDTASDGKQVVLVGSDESTAWIEVPFPPLHIEGGRTLTSLQTHVVRDRRVGVLLVRRGGYAAGVFMGRKLISSKVGSGYVQGGTKAGGWSQQRFARRRENQARAAFGAAADVAARILLPEVASLEVVVCGGDRAAVDAVLADPRLKGVAAKVAAPWLAVPDPRLKVLQATPEGFLAVRIAVYP
ncbi:MAG TPA: acVLRF1 family peptidyl-tRNA hydrolase [Jatrophihabitans sp.]